MSSMTSRERVLTAFRCGQPDHVPLVFNVFGFEPPPHLAWSNQVEMAERWLSLGVDALLEVHLPHLFHPEVRVRAWEERVPGERYPLMVKVYETPAGPLRQEVWRTDDWASGTWPGQRRGADSLTLFDDYNVPRSRRFAIEREEDLEKLRYLLWPLPDEAIARFRAQAAALAAQAEALGVALEGQGSCGTDAAMWLCGAEGMLMLALDQPALFEALLDMIQAWDRRNTEILLETPVDVVVRRAWYEGTAFWSPRLYRRFFAPRFRALTDLVHAAGRLMGYKLSNGFMPLLDTFIGIGYDVHYYIDPVQGGPGVDLARVKETFRGRIAVVGGLNSAVTLERGSREEIRQQVFEAVRVLGPGGGLVLTPVDCIYRGIPWEKIETLIAAWLEVREY
jgi:hypothetical protein